ncbi:MAG: DNA repair protein RadC [Bacteroidetes bacterium]|nr:DNA repair protein RadC [Bacteroidota bacterium]MBK9047746.1 DNA repair protein RadC [Bacteroidota bacterium]MBK9424503.1 DNA repair protein RadC [Bacteroidota bacterium]
MSYHKHPSGNLLPNGADLKLTKNLNSRGKIFEMNILDHLILTLENYFSFADEGGIIENLILIYFLIP